MKKLTFSLMAFGLLTPLLWPTVGQAKPAPKKPAPHPAPAVSAPQQAALSWLTLTDAAKYAGSWDAASPTFQAAVTKDQWVSSVRAARDPFGKFQKRTLKSGRHIAQPPGAPPGDYSLLVYDATFEKGAGTETVALYHDKDPPPPLRPANLGGLVTPPWEQMGPPPLAKSQSDEGWSVPNPGTPPPVPKRNEADEFAKALGLPDLGSLGVHHAPAPRARATVSDDEPEEAPPKKSLMWLYVLIGVAMLTGGAVFAALRTQQRPLPAKFTEDTPPSTDAASQPASEATAQAAKLMDKTSAARTDALDHYSKGNELYRHKNLPAAVDEFKKAVELDATFGLAHRGLGVAYASQSKGELAIKEYKAYLKLSPDAKDAKQVEALIKNFEK